MTTVSVGQMRTTVAGTEYWDGNNWVSLSVLTNAPLNGYPFSTTSSDYTVLKADSQTLSVKGDAYIEKDLKIDGDLKIQGYSILESLKRIEDRLGLIVPEPLKPDDKLLAMYEELQEAKQMYKELEDQFNLVQVLKD